MQITKALFDRLLRNKDNIDRPYILKDELGSNSKYITATVLLCIAFMFGIVGNLMMIAISHPLAGKRKNIPTHLILYLSIIDLLTTFAVYLPALLAYIFGHYIGGSLLCNIHSSLMIFSHSFSSLTILAIIYDRFTAVSMPYYYQDHMLFTKTKGAILILVSILISSSLSIPPLLGLGSNELIYPGSFCSFTTKNTSRLEKGSLILYVVVIALFICLVAIGCIGAAISVSKMLAFRRNLSGSQHTNNKEEYLFIRLSLVTMVIFLIIWIPLLVLMILSLTTLKIPKYYILLSYSIAGLHSVVNPWLYPILRNKYRNAFRAMFLSALHCLCCCCVDEPKRTLYDIVHDTTLGEQSRDNNIEMKNIDQDKHNNTEIKDYVDTSKPPATIKPTDVDRQKQIQVNTTVIPMASSNKNRKLSTNYDMEMEPVITTVALESKEREF